MKYKIIHPRKAEESAMLDHEQEKPKKAATRRKRSTTTSPKKTAKTAKKAQYKIQTPETGDLSAGEMKRALGGAGSSAPAKVTKAAKPKVAKRKVTRKATARAKAVPKVEPAPVPKAAEIALPPVSPEERERMVAAKAFEKSKQRNPGQADPTRDWLEAAAEVDALIAERSGS